MYINVHGQSDLRLATPLNKCSSIIGENDSQTMPDFGFPALTDAGRRILFESYKELVTLSDFELFDKMWGSGGLSIADSYLKDKISSHFRGRTGREITIPMPNSFWRNTILFSKSNFIVDVNNAIKNALNATLQSSNVLDVDISNVLNNHNLNFRTSFTNTSMFMVMGGVGEIQIRTVNSYENKDILLNYFNRNEYVVNIEVIFRDWFGMDENDFAEDDWGKNWKKALSTWLGREQLAAFWILQHQRGYPSFVWNAVFKTEIIVNTADFINDMINVNEYLSF
jgi:hypothetical protein